MDDTIAAISTPLGEGGIGIVRISGSEALKIAGKIFKPKRKKEIKRPENHKLMYGHVVNPENGEVIDEVLLAYMRSPKTYTAEDVVEINCHGGIVPLRKTLELTLKYGARPAEPGEFTKRAFLNGRIDLAQAESVLDIIRARTEKGLQIAVRQLKGRLSTKVNKIQNKILDLIAHIEANIDFPEEDLEILDTGNIKRIVEEINKELFLILEGAEKGKIYREGINAVIVGKPNVGKSSLLNALLREKRAIVTDIPGTTRDVIEEYINIRGIPLKIVDTAGLRETSELVEKLGVERTKELLGKADIVLLMLDAGTGITEEDLGVINLVDKKKTLVVINKIDVEKDVLSREKVKEIFKKRPLMEISALKEEGIEELEELIYQTIMGGNVKKQEDILISNVRHKSIIERAKTNIEDAKRALEKGLPLDLVTVDLRSAWEVMGEITGMTVGEELIDRIFRDFCVGK